MCYIENYTKGKDDANKEVKKSSDKEQKWWYSAEIESKENRQAGEPLRNTNKFSAHEDKENTKEI